MQSVTGSHGGKTMTVVFKQPYADWKGPFGPLYPAHIAKQHGKPPNLSGTARPSRSRTRSCSGSSPTRAVDLYEDCPVALLDEC